RLRDQFPEAHYVIIGDGPLRQDLDARIGSLGLRGRAHLAGWRSDAAALMPAFDVFLMPSVWEGFGLVVLEAMAARLPVIASRVSALPEIVVHGQTGILTPPADAPALTTALTRLLSDPALRQAMGDAGRARLESDFSVAQMIDSTLAVYRRFP
ncbi:MAG: glycosyltransferase, partial [Anaerolineae bacterium]|nr:glycosyltransferase [Anaerolineae bacterium]